MKENRKDKLQTKKENMRRLVRSEGPFNMQKFDPPRPMPIMPRLYVRGIEAESCTIFMSAMCPLKLDFYTQDKPDDESSHHRKTMHQNQQPSIYSVIFKSGDDVRQDQLVL